MSPPLLVGFPDNAADPASTPISLGASSVFMRHPSLCFSDDAGTTKCNDGDTLRTWQDASSGTKYTWATYAPLGVSVRPTYRTAGIDFSAGNCAFRIAGNIWPTGAMSFVAKFKMSTAVGDVLANLDASGDHPFHFWRSSTNGPVRRWSTGPQQTVANGATATISYSGTNATGAGSVEKMRLNGGSWNTVNDARPSRSGKTQDLLISSGAAFTNLTEFVAVALFPAVLSDADFAAVESWIGAL